MAKIVLGAGLVGVFFAAVVYLGTTYVISERSKAAVLETAALERVEFVIVE